MRNCLLRHIEPLQDERIRPGDRPRLMPSGEGTVSAVGAPRSSAMVQRTRAVIESGLQFDRKQKTKTSDRRKSIKSLIGISKSGRSNAIG